MQHDISVQRCLNLLGQLNVEHGWGLTSQAQRRYVQSITNLGQDISSLSDTELRRILCYYHTEHAVVEALRDSENPDHAACWAEWTRQVLRWLALKSSIAQRADEAVVSLEDLTQEALCDLWRGLPTYAYRSRFQTWTFTLISNCLVRHYRTLQTRKRGVLHHAQSLDAMLAVGDTLYDRAAPSLDDVVLSDMLTSLLEKVLEQHPDGRLTIIFQLWVHEEQTLRAIGERLDLSVTRVHGLLTQALMLLRKELMIQGWIECDAPQVLVP